MVAWELDRSQTDRYAVVQGELRYRVYLMGYEGEREGKNRDKPSGEGKRERGRSLLSRRRANGGRESWEWAELVS